MLLAEVGMRGAWSVVVGTGILAAGLACGGGGSIADDPAAYAPLAGSWYSNDWGTVVFVGSHGTYTATYSGVPGTIEVSAISPSYYEGTWAESDERFGSLMMTASPDGKQLNGTYMPDPKCTIGEMASGAFTLKR